MYTLNILRDFTARHYLIGGDWGAENQPHAHPYRVEVRLSGATLDQHGYLVDIVAVEAALEKMVSRYENALLNDLPEFAGLNPSLEHFARIICLQLAEQIPTDGLQTLAVQLWENDNAWAMYTHDLTS